MESVLGDFESKDIIDDVSAQLEEISIQNFSNEVLKTLKDINEGLKNKLQKHKLLHGTIIKISNLRDTWKPKIVEKFMGI